MTDKKKKNTLDDLWKKIDEWKREDKDIQTIIENLCPEEDRDKVVVFKVKGDK